MSPKKRLDILLADDGSQHAQAAVELLQELPLPPKSSIFVLRAFNSGQIPLISDFEKTLERSKSQLLDKGFRVETELKLGSAAQMILEGATEEQKKSLLPQLCKGESIIVPAITDKAAYWGPEGVETRLAKTPGGYLMTGAKRFVFDAQAATHFLCAARSEEDKVVFLVVDAKTPGVTITPHVGFLVSVAEVRFDNVRVAAENLLGTSGACWATLECALDKALPILCAYQVGASQEVFDFTYQFYAPTNPFWNVKPGDPYPFQGGTNPFKALLERWHTVPGGRTGTPPQDRSGDAMSYDEAFHAGTTSVIAARIRVLLIASPPASATGATTATANPSRSPSAGRVRLSPRRSLPKPWSVPSTSSPMPQWPRSTSRTNASALCSARSRSNRTTTR